ncbi:uncharacterized protein BO95DRAFT_496266 [Aspergillus brunneoviolaceus CBS 621.78]|uniref:Uncharacterized protein n=1 Tax=Aspergillus brunneoviolaceus CBS 621.78 TaxID=1450534 RepID=A0ACD1G9G2_9EURO|nr:hypothetical protein BO95DRAFT_496266 [Aspergillus brunneoviolaceus CBS 621.78]RAH45817.1 hypothetical protein BO95DRAFT_496266 [Aspergillus brunneoviolaceus CBS 621.78]
MHLLSPLSLSLSLLITTTTTFIHQATASPTWHTHAHTHSQNHAQRSPHLPTQNNQRRTFSLLPTLNLNALDLTKFSNIDLTNPNSNGEALDTLNEVLDTLPLVLEFWALNRTAGVVGMSLDMGLAELADIGLVSLGKQGAGSRGRNAKVHVNVTITGLVD